MRWVAALLWLLLAGPALAQGQDGPDRLFVGTIGRALGFLEPRTLEPVGVRQLALWGLRGLTALDPQLSVEWRDGSVRLLAVDRVIYVHGRPITTDPASWAEVVGAVVQQAAGWSDIVRRAGTGGITRSFFDELFNHLDPYSRYVAPSAAEDDRARRDGTVGPGLRLVRRGTDWAIGAVLPGSPAAEAGLQVGDRVDALDGTDLGGLTAAETERLLLGEEGTVLLLAVRSQDGQVRELEVERAAVPPETVFARWDGPSYVLRITSFNRNTASGIKRELTRAFANRRRPRSVVLDLRGNRGGLLRQATAAADLLLESGLVVVTSGRHPNASHEYEANSGDLTSGCPVIVLVDGRTASAAEILAAAIADDRRGVVIGSSTLGKGLVQTIAQLPDGGELFVTWSRVLAPGGWPLQGLGVLPQICTSRGNEALETQLRELKAGHQTMAAALSAHRAARAPVPAASMIELRSACPAAEGRDADVRAARFLGDNPAAYSTALLGPGGSDPPR